MKISSTAGCLDKTTFHYWRVSCEIHVKYMWNDHMWNYRHFTWLFHIISMWNDHVRCCPPFEPRSPIIIQPFKMVKLCKMANFPLTDTLTLFKTLKQKDAEKALLQTVKDKIKALTDQVVALEAFLQFTRQEQDDFNGRFYTRRRIIRLDELRPIFVVRLVMRL